MRSRHRSSVLILRHRRLLEDYLSNQLHPKSSSRSLSAKSRFQDFRSRTPVLVLKFLTSSQENRHPFSTRPTCKLRGQTTFRSHEGITNPRPVPRVETAIEMPCGARKTYQAGLPLRRETIQTWTRTRLKVGQCMAMMARGILALSVLVEMEDHQETLFFHRHCQAGRFRYRTVLQRRRHQITHYPYRRTRPESHRKKGIPNIPVLHNHWFDLKVQLRMFHQTTPGLLDLLLDLPLCGSSLQAL